MKSAPIAMMIRRAFALVAAVACCLALSACSGDTPVRYGTAIPAPPTGLVAGTGDGQISLSWSPSAGAASYRIYYGTAPGVGAAGGSAVDVPGTSWTLTGLRNGTAYYLSVAAVVASGESRLSAEVSATPAVPGPVGQQALEGVWNFNVLVTGDAPGWMRGTLAVGSGWAVTYTLYEESAGGRVPPARLFPALLVHPGGEVSDAAGSTPGFRGALAANGALVVGTGPWTGSSRYLAFLQKRSSLTFVAADLQGFGGSGGGGRRFVYHQVGSGTGGEWEWAAGQLGRDQRVQYASVVAPSGPAVPGDKATIMNISSSGIVTESLAGALPEPPVLMDRAVMSDGKDYMIGVATDSSRGAPRYVMRIYQMINIRPLDANAFAYTDLVGEYRFHTLVSGATALSASGLLAVDAAGSAAYGSYADSAGGTAAPAFSLLVDSNGVLGGPSDASLHGKLSYLKDLLILTRSEASGGWSMTVGLKR